MQRNSVSYTIAFSGAICVVCSLVVSSSATLLKERQEENARLDRQKRVYAVSNSIYKASDIDVAEVKTFFELRIQDKTVTLEPAVSGGDSKEALVYEVYDEAGVAGGELECLVLPVEGMGLWGTLYGYLAIENDGNTIRGLTFYDHKETPGLGGEVDNPRWKAKWEGRIAYDENWVPAIKVIKGPAPKPGEAPHKVDGLSGATLTSVGVSKLVRFWLGPEGFGPYLEAFRNARSTV